MGAFIDLTGHKYGKLTPIKRVGTKRGSPLWFCQCECGDTIEVTTNALRSGNTNSCGCIHREQLIKRNEDNATHGKTNTRLYGVWHSMKQRCYDKNDKSYPNYGGRGIKICDDWKDNFESFYDWAYENGYDENAEYGDCTIDRVDNDGDYIPNNCRWVDMKVQSNNRRERRMASANS